MVLSINKTKLDNLASEIWKSAQRLRGKFKAYEYQSVILPIIVIRRLECVLIKWREDIEAFLKREIAKPIIRWQDSPQLGYEILPNKYFYRYQPPPPANELLNEFWRLEKEAEKMLEGLGK